MMDDRYYMQLALEEARKAADLGEIPIGAVLVHEGEVVCRGHNMRETWQSATAHAEVIVIEEACKKLARRVPLPSPHFEQGLHGWQGQPSSFPKASSSLLVREYSTQLSAKAS